MSMDRSLKSKASLSRHRNVLTRPERVKRLRDEERFAVGMMPTGLPKVANRKANVGAKTKKAAAEGDAAATPGAPAAAAAAPAKAAPAKTAAKAPAKK